MRTENVEICIISAELATNSTLVNQSATTRIEIGLQDLKHTKCLGVYKGTPEVSFLVIIHSDKDRAKLIDLAQDFNQESILISRPDRSSYLYMIENGDKIELGELQEVESVEGLDAFTIVTINDRETIWTCK